MLAIDSLSFDYDDTPLLHGVHFSVQRGQCLHLQGANGKGKTTLLRLLAGLIRPHQGQIRWDNTDIHAGLAAYQQHLQYVGHKPGCNALLSVRENLALTLHTPIEGSCLETALASFNLQQVADKHTGLLSAGQRRRVSLARLQLRPAVLWLLDEPLTALDKESAHLVMDTITTQVKQGGVVILTAHQTLNFPDIDLLEYSL